MGDKKEAVGFMKKIYILHGWTYSTDKWMPFVEELEKHGIEAEMLKIPGLTAPLNEVWNIDNYTDWLSKSLSKVKDPSAPFGSAQGKSSGQEPVILLGHSNGGLIALSYVLKYPDKVKKLILVDSTGIYHRELSIRLKRFVFASAANIGKKLTTSPMLKKYLYKFARVHDYEKANPITQKTMRNLIQVDYSQALKNIRIPTVIIWGENDVVTPVKDGRFMLGEIKNSTLNIIRDARHSPQFTNYKEVADVILNSFQDLKSKGK